MVQWVASPLNQGYFFLTRLSAEGEMEEARSPPIAEEAEDETNLVSSAIQSLRITKHSPDFCGDSDESRICELELGLVTSGSDKVKIISIQMHII